MGRIEYTLLDEGEGSTPTDLRTFARKHAPYHKKRQMFLSITKGRDY
jgi:hypothetical protein